MKKVRYGIVGFGNMGTKHANSIHEGKISDSVLSGICDSDPKRLEVAKEIYKDNVKYFDNYKDMIESKEIDAIIIAVPHYDHPQMSIDAFENNIHVMCEKPAGVFTKDVRRMNEAYKKSENLVFGMMFNQRTNSLYKKMKELVDNGDLGDIRRVNWIITDWYRPQIYYDSGAWRATWAGEGGGVLLNQCPHNLDLWQWICGMPKKITAFAQEGKLRNIEVENDVTAYAEYENGATAVFVTSTVDTPGTNRFEITGDKGKLVCENNELYFYKLEIPESIFSVETKEPFGGPKIETIKIETDGTNPQHIGVLNSFSDAILGKGELIANGEEGINGLMLSNAMHLSSWLNKTVELPIDEDLFYELLQEKIKNSKEKSNVVNVTSKNFDSSY